MNLLRREIEIERPIEEVFGFFNRPENLARITPPSMGFKILTPSPVLMASGSVIDYTVCVSGLPMRWTSQIEDYDPPRQFVDRQLRGPYAHWHHTHRFEPTARGTLVIDEVRYRLPFGFLGQLGQGFVQRQLDTIFNYRSKVIQDIFAGTSANARGGKVMKIVITGATGFIGKPLVAKLSAAGHHLVLLTRDPALSHWHVTPKLQVLQWDGRSPGKWSAAFEGADAVINLAGESIAAKRWTPEQKERLLKSRIDATRTIVQAIQAAKNKPKVLINGSAVGFYGPVEQGDVTEETPLGHGFLANLCDVWEKETVPLKNSGVRVVLLRTGIVLERGGGALAKMEFPFKIFAGGPLGSGQQWFPWIHRDDEIGLIEFALTSDKVSGPLNATAPEPLTMTEFCKALGRALHRPSWAPVPAFALKVLLGEMSEMLLTGQKAIPHKALQAGYVFKYPTADAALKAVYTV